MAASRIAPFALLRTSGDACWAEFRDPSDIFIARTVDEVIPVLQEVECKVAEGYWAVVFVSYEAAPAFDPVMRVQECQKFPLAWAAIFPRFTARQSVDVETGYKLGTWYPEISFDEYATSFRKVKEFIRAGDTYQINYTYRMVNTFSGEPLAFFLDLWRCQKTELAAFLDIGDWAICSVSPELFFEGQKGRLISRPMKGTIDRGRFWEEDIQKARRLHFSEKNRAENVMIVDMVRNDLSKIAKPGKVAVKKLFQLEKYATVWQMTSTIAVESPLDLSNVFSALFPPASITGAPKIRAMDIIASIEASPRKVYTGCIGLVAPDHSSRFNVAIRTALVDRRKATVEFGVGGGIVWDSRLNEEYTETNTKIQVLAGLEDFRLFESLLWQPEKGYFLLDRHVKRLQRSARYFGFPFSREKILQKLEQACQSFPNEDLKVRLFLSHTGSVELDFSKLTVDSVSGFVKLALAPDPVSSRNRFLYHKTTNRAHFDRLKKQCSHADDVILWNEKQEITETTIANLVFKIDGNLFTPPVDSGLLPGTFRAQLLEQGQITEKIIYIDDLNRCEEMFVINSVRKWQKAELLHSEFDVD